MARRIVEGLLLLLVALPVAASTLALAQERLPLTQRQTEIMRLVAQSDGYVTPELHREFWDAVPSDIRADPRRLTRLAIDFAYLPLVYGSFERELWNSAKLSLDKDDVLSTEDYAGAKEKLKLFMDVASFSAPTFVAAVSEADNILHAAANGSHYSAGQASMAIDASQIDAALAGMDAAQSRLSRLLDPAFPFRPKEWRYPDGHFRIFWPDPLVESRAAIPDGGYGREVVIYSNRFDRDVYLSVQFLSLFAAESDPVRAKLYARLLATQMGFPEAKAVTADWEDHSSALVDATSVIDGREAELSLRLVLAPEHKGAWVLVCLSVGTQGFAEALRVNLDAAVRPD